MNRNLRQTLESIQALGVNFTKNLYFNLTDFPVRDDQEISGTACGIEKFQARQFVMQRRQSLVAGLRSLQRPRLIQLRSQAVKKQRFNHFHDVLLCRVMRAGRSSLFRIHDGLEEGAENRRGYFRPIEGTGFEKPLSHVSVKIGRSIKRFLEQIPVDMGKLGQIVVQPLRPMVFWQIQCLEYF